MSVDTCGTCEHFRPTKGTEAGSCARWIASYQYSEAMVPAGEVVVEVDEGWGAIMHREFGCRLWNKAAARV